MYFYDPLNQTRLLEEIITEVGVLGLNDDHYITGYFNINLLNGNNFLTGETKLENSRKNFRPA